MKTTHTFFRKYALTSICLLVAVILMQSCSNDSVLEELENQRIDSISESDLSEDNENTSEEPSTDESGQNPEEEMEDDLPCPITSQVIQEKDGMVVFEFENDSFEEPWNLDNGISDSSGSGYVYWDGDQYLGAPGNGTVTYNIEITNPGTYQFIWNSAVAMGNSGTDHNDTWLRFPGAADYYAQKGTSIVFPKGSGKSPNPEGAGADGWFKVYRSGNNLGFKWQASTFDNNAHDIFVEFSAPGTYKMEISARSSGHAIDKVMLFKTSIPKNTALENTADLSTITCEE